MVVSRSCIQPQSKDISDETSPTRPRRRPSARHADPPHPLIQRRHRPMGWHNGDHAAPPAHLQRPPPRLARLLHPRRVAGPIPQYKFQIHPRVPACFCATHSCPHLGLRFAPGLFTHRAAPPSLSSSHLPPDSSDTRVPLHPLHCAPGAGVLQVLFRVRVRCSSQTTQ